MLRGGPQDFTRLSRLLAIVRDHFRREGLLEVATPALAAWGASDPHLVNLPVEDGGARLYLQTSPEYAMKKLLADAHRSVHQSGIYQICPAFRGGETGKRHSRDFLLLEWYRCHWSLPELMDDLARLFAAVTAALPHALPGVDLARASYGALFMDALGLNPHTASRAQLAELAAAQGLEHLGPKAQKDAQREDFLDGLFATAIEPRLVQPTIVYDYPACQAALACLKQNEAGEQVADRFEFFAAGMEIANAYNELRDAEALAARFARNNRVRRVRGLPQMAADTEFLAAVKRMPEAAGIALGLERLLMALAAPKRSA